MPDDNNSVINASEYGFDPAYGYSLEQLLAVMPPKEPKISTAFGKRAT